MTHRAPFYVALLLLLVLALVMLRAVIAPTLLGAIVAYLLLPLYDRLQARIAGPGLRAGLLVVLVLFVLALPVILIATQAASQLPHALHSGDIAGGIENLNEWVDEKVGRHVPLRERVFPYLRSFGENAMHDGRGVLGIVGHTALGLMLMLYALYYTLRDGRRLWQEFLLVLPLSDRVKPVLVMDLQQTLSGVIYGQLFTASILGALMGIAYWIFHVSHVLFWTLLSAILAIIPIIGPNAIWAPIALMKLLSGDGGDALGLLLVCGGSIVIVDHFVKPRLIAGRSALHPMAALLGVIGGLEFFGITGFIFGPVLLSLVAAMLRFHRDVAVLQVEVVTPAAVPSE